MKTTTLPGGHVTVALSGDIDILAAPAVRDVVGGAAGQAVSGLIIDLGEVTFLDAAGLGVLADAYRQTRHLPEGLRLVAVSARVLRLLEITGLDRHLAAFRAPPGSQPRHWRPAPPVAATAAAPVGTGHADLT
jgi:anti-sigma B factor antagonist